MSVEAYDRARKFLSDRPGAVLRARLLGVVQSLLVLGLLAITGLLFELVTTSGAVAIPTAELANLPTWIESLRRGEKGASALIEDSGLFTIYAENFDNSNPVHRFGAGAVLRLVRAVPALHSNRGALAFLVCLALAHVLLLALTTRLRRSGLAEAACGSAAALRRLIHRQMYRLGQSSLPTEGTGPVVNLFTREVNDVRDAQYAELDVSWRMPTLVAGLALFLLFVSFKATLFLGSLAVLVWLTSRVLGKSSAALSVAAVRDAALSLSALQEDLSLLRIVRVHGMEDVDKARFDEHLDRHTEADIRRVKSDGHGRTVLFLLYGSAAVAAFGFLASEVALRGHSPTAALFVLVALAGLVIPPFEWVRMKRAIGQGTRSAQSIFHYLDRRPELHQAGGAQFLAPIKDRITFENVTLDDRSGRHLLVGLSVEVRKGTRIAIMGVDEDAKHAMVCLIPRLIDPKVGRVRIDGVDLRDVTLESIRAQVSTVLQSDLVFSDTIYANIGLGDPSYPLPRIIEAAKLAHAHQFINDLPLGYETPIGPLGHYLTTDQQFRIGLARAALHDPSIVIVEEPHGPLDDEVKHLLDDTLSRLGQGRTLIVLPHRLSTIRSCDQVIVLQSGRIEASGPPREVHAESKLYRHLQYMEFNQFATGEVEAGQMNA